jgi:hypothetical protein
LPPSERGRAGGAHGTGTIIASGTTTFISASGTGANVTNSSPLTIPAKPCGTGLTAHFLTAASQAGNFFGIFCVNSAGTGPYTQFSVGPTVSQTASGTGTIKVSGTTTAIAASGTKLALLGEKTSTFSSFTETAPAPMKSGTFTLT